jgi:carbamoyltransferase
MRILGINCLNHDAAMAVVDGSEILWAAHSERYSKVKNDHYLNHDIVREAYRHGPFDKIVYYERPLIKKMRQARAGQWSEVFQTNNLPSRHCRQFGIHIDEYVDHHHSHAAGGYYTSPFHDAIVLTVDGIGEWETITIWSALGKKMEKVYSLSYPHSIGLLYSAFTQRAGLKPCEEEYILMGMSAYGQPKWINEIYRDFVHHGDFRMKENLHRGIGNWLEKADPMDLAASIQWVTEDLVDGLFRKAHSFIPKGQIGVSRFSDARNLVYSGGVALNCVANSQMANRHYFDNIWIMPNPGDAGSSLGCIAASEKRHLKWKNPFLGHNIEGEYPVDAVIKELEISKMVGVANGRAEFGPRALGNRSLLADPRGSEIKDTVNSIKRRQQFRPFAPAILEEDVHEYFVMPRYAQTSPYMQFTARVKHPTDFPAITHHDGTARVQTVSKADNPGFYELLKQWKKKTGCPMLLNTSLNIKGEPIVNDKMDAKRFETKYNVRVL